MANFSGSPALTITVNYSPIEGNLEAEDHYDHLTAAVREIPKHNMLIVTGDFNSHLDQSVIEYSYHNTCNSNGRLVKNLFKGTNLSLQMEGSRRGLGSSGHYFAYEWYENKGRLHRGQEKMKELCTRLSFKANEETAKEVLPKRKKDRKTKASDDSRMVKVREEYLQIASDRYYRSPTENNREEMERYKSKLHEQYNITIEEDLDKMIRQV